MKRCDEPIARYPITFLLLLLAFLSVCGPLPVWSDEVVMTTGDRFKADQVWEEGDKIRFNLQGLMVSVDKAEVATIIRNGKASTPPAASPDFQKPLLSSPPTEPHTALTPSALRDTPPSGRKGVAKDIGIDGIFWRMPTRELSGLTKVETDPAFGGIDQYYREDQPLRFAGAPLDGIVYGFWDGQLYSIMMWAEGRISYDRLRRSVFSTFGRGTQLKPELERYVWDGKTTQRMLEFDAQLKTGIFVMRSAELDAVIKERYPSMVRR